MPTFTRKLSDMLNEGYDLGLTVLDYPIFDEDYRVPLNTKITRHYWNYEIGQETESMFRFSLNRKMNEIMPYYNQIYLSTRINFDPMKSVNYTDVFNSTDESTGMSDDTATNTATSSNDTNSRARTVQSDTPQVLLSPNEDYASGAANTVSDAVATGSTEANGTNSNTRSDNNVSHTDRTIEGFQVPQSELLMLYRQTLLNVDMLVIENLRTLFMQIWDNGDEFSATEGLFNGYSTNYIGLF
jgi:hypothetical protein